MHTAPTTNSPSLPSQRTAVPLFLTLYAYPDPTSRYVRRSTPSATLVSSNTYHPMPAAGAIFSRLGNNPLYSPRTPSRAMVLRNTSTMPLYLSSGTSPCPTWPLWDAAWDPVDPWVAALAADPWAAVCSTVPWVGPCAAAAAGAGRWRCTWLWLRPDCACSRVRTSASGYDTTWGGGRASRMAQASWLQVHHDRLPIQHSWAPAR